VSWVKLGVSLTNLLEQYDNQWYGTQQVPNIFKLESQLGFFAQSITVTDKAYRDQGRLGVEFLYTDYNGTTSKVNKFLAMYEAKMLDELYRSMEVQLVYGKKSTTAGPGGYWQKTGFSGPLCIVIYIA
jgi:hypothetical protein